MTRPSSSDSVFDREFPHHPSQNGSGRLTGAPSGYWLRMARVVVVATSSVDRSVLAGHLEPDDELFVVVPAVEQSRLAWLTNDESDCTGRGTGGRRVHRRRRTTRSARRRRQARRTEPGRSRRDRRASSGSDHRRNPGRRRRDMARGRRARPSTRPDRRRTGDARRDLKPRTEAGQARRVESSHPRCRNPCKSA